MKPVKHIVDTTLRDGEQSAGIALGIEDKVKIAKRLDEMGVYEIEAGIPCIGEEEEEGILRILDVANNAKISVWSRMNIVDVERSVALKPHIVHIGVPVSYIQIYSKLRKNKAWVQKNILQCVEVALKSNVEVTVGFEDASRADPGFLISLAKELEKNSVHMIRIADTVGVLSPGRTKEMIETIKAHTAIPIEIHVHNDLGMAVANSIIAAKAGADYIDCTLFGIGERAGNCNLYDFVRASQSIFTFAMTTKQIQIAEQEAFSLLQEAM